MDRLEITIAKLRAMRVLSEKEALARGAKPMADLPEYETREWAELLARPTIF